MCVCVLAQCISSSPRRPPRVRDTRRMRTRATSTASPRPSGRRRRCVRMFALAQYGRIQSCRTRFASCDAAACACVRASLVHHYMSVSAGTTCAHLFGIALLTTVPLQMEVRGRHLHAQRQAGGQLGPWASGRTGRSSLGWEEPVVKCVGGEWWHEGTNRRPRDPDSAIVNALSP